ncbi:hypothetical protein ABFS82_02G177600 [Erythranthe guttata]|uniref:DNA-directed RNA polymerase subunit n=1 Tax=Erythranthe guttata TaxID=4155 RepID=A0A022R0E4_ERYGU|nr:PREDICTED: DNA-directed RNA polymerase III subunit RPC10 [Erythranthe guttata]XP_012843881.1 PREDICTED: DNA-directed RNA polymerase III subunit RPC10 [Erythranthe guttata]EYU32275.1 hypothetical protein MIMGU_mgv1a016692mg [Erythranthe guttata]|eukprot:XP_012843880.1 PREDICTED: DNA-directed RNA polymerase III subunit RPC10 [Erythranthe guttata]
MEFCPTCGNMLLYELPHMDRPASFSCPTCPYACQIETKVKIKRHLRLVKKPIDPIFSEDDQNINSNKTTGVSCPDCNHGEATFFQVQTRSADEPMTIFYTCTKCKRTWTEN